MGKIIPTVILLWTVGVLSDATHLLVADKISVVLFGATKCDSQNGTTEEQCPSLPNMVCPVSETVKLCNQASGNHTMICQVKGAGGNSCDSNNGKCAARADDALLKKDANGQDCTNVTKS